MKNLSRREERAAALVDLMPALKRLALALTRNADQAEELTQDALLKVWAKLSEGAKIEDLRPYLMTALRNQYRRRMIRSEALTEAKTPTTPAVAHARIACAEVLAAVDRLPPQQAQMIHRMLAHDGTFAELAKDMSLPLGTVMSRLARARAQLRNEVDLPTGHPVTELFEETAS